MMEIPKHTYMVQVPADKLIFAACPSLSELESDVSSRLEDVLQDDYTYQRLYHNRSFLRACASYISCRLLDSELNADYEQLITDSIWSCQRQYA